MKASEMFLPTLREVPKEAEIISHQLMLRAGIMRKVAAGVYCFLPLGNRVFRKVEQIVREEMDRAGACELKMPALLPAEVYKDSGRLDIYGPEMFRLNDRNGRDFCLGPTHEEIFTNTVKQEIKSYKMLPINLYQIQTKYRDERRPRFGVIRSREFVMKDAYSFDKDEAGLDISYEKMKKAYTRIFERCGLDFTIVDADPGAIGGSGSQEFMVKSEIGEAIIAYCDACGYAANDEKAPCITKTLDVDNQELKEIQEVLTPNSRTIEELTDFFGCSPKDFAKTLIYKADGKLVVAMVRGDRELNETKLKNYLNCIELEMASQEEVEKLTKAKVGFAGPIGLEGVQIIADNEILNMRNFVVGANKTEYHLKNVNYGRDFKADVVMDIRTVASGDSCPHCGEKLKLARGIEVGHIFKLGTKYSDALGCNYLDENGNEVPMIMGCYGIGINRILAAVIEQNNDDDGIIWPVSVAPYHVVVVPVNVKDEEQCNLAEKIHNELSGCGIEVVLDDRNERPGVKFKDCDLIGYPIRIVVGKKAGEGIVEFKLRNSNEKQELDYQDAIKKACEIIK